MGSSFRAAYEQSLNAFKYIVGMETGPCPGRLFDEEGISVDQPNVRNPLGGQYMQEGGSSFPGAPKPIPGFSNVKGAVPTRIPQGFSNPAIETLFQGGAVKISE